MSKKRIKMPTGGRTSGGKNADFSPEEHYLRRLKNRLDGAGQKERKAILAALGFDRSVDPTRAEIDERLRKGVANFDEIVALAGGETLPGCGSILIFDVASRRPESRLISEDKAVRRLKALGRVNYYWRKRTGKGRKGKDRSGLRKEWPGLVKRLITLNPGDSQALEQAVKSGGMSPDEFRQRLLGMASVVALEVRQATHLPGAAKGLEPELVVAHLEQGVIHLHVYSRDVDITKPERPRLGLFLKSGSGREKPRLTLNGLGISGVAMRRHRSAGHEPPLEIFGDELCCDWRILEVSEKFRAEKGLGPCWDVVVSDTVDAYWARVFEQANLKRFREDAHATWRKEWEAKCAAKRRLLESLARGIFAKEIAKAQENERERLKAEGAARKAVEDKLVLEEQLKKVVSAQRQQASDAEAAHREVARITRQAEYMLELKDVVQAVREFNLDPGSVALPEFWVTANFVVLDATGRLTVSDGFWEALKLISAFPSETARLAEEAKQLCAVVAAEVTKPMGSKSLSADRKAVFDRPAFDRGVT